MTDERKLTAADLQINISPPTGDLDDLIHDRVMQAYELQGRNVAATSKTLGIHRATIYRHLRVEKNRYSAPDVSRRKRAR